MTLHTKRILTSAFLAVAVVSVTAWASSLTLPNTFTAGTTAKASEVNANFAAVKAAVDDNNARITALQTVATYTAPTFFTGWSNVGAPWMTAGYTRDAMGFVHLRGLVKQAGGTGNIFSLPAGFQPSANLQFAARCGDSSMCYVTINSNGNVDFGGTAGAAAGSLTLDGIVFDPH